MSLGEKLLIRGSLEKFCNKVNSLLPIRHMSQHNDEARIRDVAKEEVDQGCVDFMRKLNGTSGISLERRGVLVGELCFWHKRLIDEYVAVNQEYKTKWELFLEKRIEGLCEDLRTSLEIKLLIKPDMDLQSFESFFESAKLAATSYFQRMWKHGNADTFEEQKRKLEQKLDDLKKEVLERMEGQGTMERSDEAVGNDEDASRWTEELDRNFTSLSIENENEAPEIQPQRMNIATTTNNESSSVWSETIDVDNLTWDCFWELVTEKSNQPLDLKADHENRDDQCVRVPSPTATEEQMNEMKMLAIMSEWFDSDSDSKEENNVMVEYRGDHQNNLNGPSATLPTSAPASKEFELHSPAPVASSQTETGTSWSSLNVPDQYGVTPLLHALGEGENVESIQKMLDSGADVNAKTIGGFNAVYMTILSLIKGKQTSSQALVILSLLVAKEPKLTNQKTELGYTPLFLAMKCENLDETLLRWFYENGADFNAVDGEYGNSLLLHAILYGQEAGLIGKILEFGDNPKQVNGLDDCALQKMVEVDAEAKVNFKSGSGLTAAHAVIFSLIDGKQTTAGALAILNLLVAKGFKLINQKTTKGITPLFLAMKFENLDVKLLRWFHENGADFNAVENKYGNSILFEAISHGNCGEVICKILKFGANPKHINRMGDNALHMSARVADDAALRIFVDRLDVNGVNEASSTPLSLLFMRDKQWFNENCFKILLEKGADFRGSCDKGCANTLVHWFKHGEANPFPALVKAKDRLPITEEIASVALTTIVEEIARLQKFLVSSFWDDDDEQGAFVQFAVFLIQEKNAKLNLQCEGKYKLQNFMDLEKILLNTEFMENLKSIDIDGVKWKDPVTGIKSASLTKVEYLTDQGDSVCVPIEVVLGCLLLSGTFRGFVDLCRSLLNAVQECRWRKGDRNKCLVQ